MFSTVFHFLVSEAEFRKEAQGQVIGGGSRIRMSEWDLLEGRDVCIN